MLLLEDVEDDELFREVWEFFSFMEDFREVWESWMECFLQKTTNLKLTRSQLTIL